MRRPITLIVAFYSVGIFLGYYLETVQWGLFWAGVLLFWLCRWILSGDGQKKSKVGYLYVCILILLGGFGSFYLQFLDNKTDYLIDYDGEIITIKGQVLTVEDRNEYLKILINTDEIDTDEGGSFYKGRVFANIYFSTPDPEKKREEISGIKSRLTGAKVKLKGRFVYPPGMRNPGLFDYRLYLKTKGAGGSISVENAHLEISKQRALARALPYHLKYRFSSLLDNYIDPPSKGLLLGILFGDKGLIEEDIYEDFQRNGCAHILSVSGIHVNIIYIYVSMVFRNRRNPLGSGCTIGFLLFYAALAEFSPSVVRAVLMIIISIISKYLHRRHDLFCTICVSAMLMLAYNPFYLFSLGFQLSYLAVLTLAFALPLVESKIEKLEEKNGFLTGGKILRIFAPVFVIQLGMAPITAYHFFYFSLAAFFINIPIIGLSSMVLPISIVLVILTVFPEGNLFFGIVATADELLLKAMAVINEFVAALSLSSINARAPSALAMALFYGMFFFITSEEFWRICRNRNKEKILWLIICILCLTCFFSFIIGENQRKADIVFVDVGQGDSIHLRTPGGKNVLIDGGGSREYDIGKKVLMPYLLKNGVKKIDLAIVTHLHEDHYRGISSLCRLMDVDNLAIYASNLLKEEEIKRDTGFEKRQLSYVVAGDRIIIEKDIYIDILHPQKRTTEEYKDILAYEKEENLSSLVVKINYKGISILVTGDMGFDGEDYIMKEYGEDNKSILESDILKVGHHGSKYSTGITFLETVKPKIAVIQVGKNNFGHPHGDVIEKLMEKDIMVFRNDENGAVLINIKQNSINIKTMLP